MLVSGIWCARAVLNWQANQIGAGPAKPAPQPVHSEVPAVVSPVASAKTKLAMGADGPRLEID